MDSDYFDGHSVTISHNEDGWLAAFDEIPLVHAQDETIKSALDELIEVWEEYKHELLKHNQKLPSPKFNKSYFDRVVIKLNDKEYRELAIQAEQAKETMSQRIRKKTGYFVRVEKK